MFYEVVESRPYLGTSHAEAVDDERRVFVAIFSGPEAEQRAREYATWKNASRRETAIAGSARLASNPPHGVRLRRMSGNVYG